MMFGATTVATPAAAPILSTLLLLIVLSVVFPTLCRSFAFFLGIESPFSRSVGLNLKNPLLFVMTLPWTVVIKLSILVQLPGKGDQFERRGPC
jgi:hypothetical protein